MTKRPSRRAGNAAARQRVQQNNSADTAITAAPQGLEFHPLAHLFPLMEGAEYDEFVEDVAAHGIREAIWLYEGKILEGRNRYRAAAAAGVACPMRPYEGDDPLAFVISYNLKRRHLTPKQKREVIEALLKATPRKSDRQVARKTGVSHTQVAKVRRKLEASGDVATIATSTDSLGREQPRTRKRRQSKPAAEGAPPVAKPGFPDAVRKQLVRIVSSDERSSILFARLRRLSEDEGWLLLGNLARVRERIDRAIGLLRSLLDSDRSNGEGEHE